MRPIFLTVAAMAALTLAACQPAADGGDSEAPTVADAATDASDAAAPASSMVLSGEGLRVTGDAGQAETIALGASRQVALAAVTRAMGTGPSDSRAFEECGAGATDYAGWDEFTLLFTGEELSGWESTSDEIETPEGIHAGSTIEELRAAYPEVEIQETTVGWAFSAGDMYGLLNEAQTQVDLIRLGANCDAH